MSVWRKFRPNGFASLFDVEIRPAEQAIGFTQSANLLRLESTAFEANLIDASDFCRVSIGNHKWGNVLNDLGAASEDGMATDSAELVDSAKSADDGIVLDDDVAGESAVIRKDHIVADEAIMGNM